MNVILKDVNIHLENRQKSRCFFVFIWIVYAFVHMTKNGFGAAMASIVSEGILTKSQTGLIIAVFYVVYAPLQVVGGVLADRYSPEKLIKIGLSGAALVNLVIFFNHNYYVILVAWTFNAVIQSPIWPAVFKIVSSQLVRSDRTNMVFLMSFSNSFGLILGYGMAAFIPSWQYNFLVSAVILLICAVMLDLFCVKLDSYMKSDKKRNLKKLSRTRIHNFSTLKLFAVGGFLFFLPSVLLRTSVENGIKTLSPVIMMESYTNVSASMGNILNLFVIASGILGVIIVKLVLYPKIIKNELTVVFIMLLLSVPFCLVMKFIGDVPIPIMVVSMCMISMLLTPTGLLTSYYNARFSTYGKNGVAAGTSNAASSIGVILQSYGFVYIADVYNWNTVMSLWVIIIITAIVFTLLAMFLFRKFEDSNYVF